jgi:hypothetical protein
MHTTPISRSLHSSVASAQNHPPPGAALRLRLSTLWLSTHSAKLSSGTPWPNQAEETAGSSAACASLPAQLAAALPAAICCIHSIHSIHSIHCPPRVTLSQTPQSDEWRPAVKHSLTCNTAHWRFKIDEDCTDTLRCSHTTACALRRAAHPQPAATAGKSGAAACPRRPGLAWALGQAACGAPGRARPPIGPRC